MLQTLAGPLFEIAILCRPLVNFIGLLAELNFTGLNFRLDVRQGGQHAIWGRTAVHAEDIRAADKAHDVFMVGKGKVCAVPRHKTRQAAGQKLPLGIVGLNANAVLKTLFHTGVDSCECLLRICFCNLLHGLSAVRTDYNNQVVNTISGKGFHLRRRFAKRSGFHILNSIPSSSLAWQMPSQRQSLKFEFPRALKTMALFPVGLLLPGSEEVAGSFSAGAPQYSRSG